MPRPPSSPSRLPVVGAPLAPDAQVGAAGVAHQEFVTTRRPLFKLQDRLFAALITGGTYVMCRLFAAHRFFDGVHQNAVTPSGQLVPLLLALPPDTSPKTQV